MFYLRTLATVKRRLRALCLLTWWFYLEHYVCSHDDCRALCLLAWWFFVSSLARSVNFLGSSLLCLSTWISRMVQRFIDVTTRMVQRFFDMTIRMVQRFIDVTIHLRKQASRIKAYYPSKLTAVKGRWYGHRGIRIISRMYLKIKASLSLVHGRVVDRRSRVAGYFGRVVGYHVWAVGCRHVEHPKLVTD